jgi:hypothetical protein
MEVREQRLAHLEHLAEELTGQGFRTELAGKGAKPYLKVANASTPALNERVRCEQAEDGSWSFWWPWHQPIGSADDVQTVVGKIAVVLRPIEAEQ